MREYIEETYKSTLRYLIRLKFYFSKFDDIVELVSVGEIKFRDEYTKIINSDNQTVQKYNSYIEMGNNIFPKLREDINCILSKLGVTNVKEGGRCWFDFGLPNTIFSL